MALYKTPKAAIIGAIKALNGVTLIESEYVFGAPVAVAPAGDGTNTTISITAKDTTSTFDGTVTVRYIRLQLSDLLVLIPATVQVPAVTNTIDFADALNRIYGTNFTGDDIVNEAVNLVDGVGTVTLNAKPTSLGWIGSVTFTIERGRLSIADYVTVVDLPGLNFPDAYEGKPFGWAYSYWRNYSPVHDLIDAMSAESPDWVNIRDVLVTMTGDPWVLTGQNRYSLEGATVAYMGPTSGASFTNDTYQKVLVVLLGEACLGYSGRLYFHYNIPETDI
jgi:hypothetical protein